MNANMNVNRQWQTIASTHEAQGRLIAAAAVYHARLPDPVALMGLARLAYETNQLDHSLAHLETLLKHPDLNPMLRLEAHVLTAQNYHARFEARLLAAHLDQALALSAGMAMPTAAILAQAADAFWRGIDQDAFQVRVWLQRLDAIRLIADLSIPLAWRMIIEQHVCRLWLRLGDSSRAAALINLIDQQLAVQSHHGRQIAARVLRSAILEADDQLEAALGMMESAVRLAAPYDYCRVFVDGGASAALLLYELLLRRVEPPTVTRLLSSFRAP